MSNLWFPSLYDPSRKPEFPAEVDRDGLLAHGLVGCWLMNEGAGTIVQDASGNGGTLTLGSGCSWVGNCVAVDGTNPDMSGPDLDLPTEATFIVWFTLPTVAWNFAGAVGKATGTVFGDPYNFWIGSDKGIDWQSNVQAVKPIYTATSDLVDGNTYQMAFVASNTKQFLRLYLNGQLKAERTSVTPLGTPNDDPLRIGSMTDVHRGNCTFHSVDIYNRALSAQEVASLSTAPYQMFHRPRIELWAAIIAGEGTGTQALAGTVTAISVANGILNVARSVTGSIGGLTGATGVLSVVRTLAGTIAGTSGVAGAMSITGGFAGSVSGTSGIDGELSVTRGLGGSASGTSGVAGVLNVERALGGSVDGVAGADGTLSVDRQFAGSVPGVSGASGDLSVAKSLAGSVAGTSSVSGSLSVSSAFALWFPSLCDPSRKPEFPAEVDRDGPLAHGLVAYWLANEAAGNRLQDALGDRANTGSFGATGPAWVAGNEGPSLLFTVSNTEYVSISPCPVPLRCIGTDFTVMATVNPVSVLSATRLVLGNNKVTAGGGWSIVLTQTSGRANLNISDQGLASPNNLYVLNEWHTIVITFQAATRLVTFYRDGVFFGTQTATVDVGYTADAPFVFGIDPTDMAGNNMDGKISKAAVWRRALTAGEVAEVSIVSFQMFLHPRIELWATAAGGEGETQSLAGTVAATSGADGVLSIARQFAGSVAAESEAVGSLSVTGGFAGTVSGISGTSGSLSIARGLAGSVSAVSGATGTLGILGNVEFQGIVAGESSVSGSLSVARAFAGSVAVTSGTSGNLCMIRALAGSVACVSSATGAMSNLVPFTGSITATTACVGDLVITRGLGGVVAGTSGVIGGICVARSFAGSVYGQSGATGTLIVPGTFGIAAIAFLLIRKAR